MKKAIKLLLGLLLVLGTSELSAQGPSTPVIYREWKMLVESTTQIDISYRVLKCTTTDQVHLMIFNESINDQTIKFDLEIKNNSTGDTYVKEISFPTSKATIYKAQCDSDSSFDALKINLPSGYDPNDIALKIIFKP